MKGDFYSLRLHDAYCILIFLGTFDFAKIHSQSILNDKQTDLQGDQDHFLSKEMLISPLFLQLHKNP